MLLLLLVCAVCYGFGSGCLIWFGFKVKTGYFFTWAPPDPFFWNDLLAVLEGLKLRLSKLSNFLSVACLSSLINFMLVLLMPIFWRFLIVSSGISFETCRHILGSYPSSRRSFTYSIWTILSFDACGPVAIPQRQNFSLNSYLRNPLETYPSHTMSRSITSSALRAPKMLLSPQWESIWPYLFILSVGMLASLPIELMIPLGPMSLMWSVAALTSFSHHFNAFKGYCWFKYSIASTYASCPSVVCK